VRVENSKNATIEKRNNRRINGWFHNRHFLNLNRLLSFYRDTTKKKVTTAVFTIGINIAKSYGEKDFDNIDSASLASFRSVSTHHWN
jgi:hypothetical protein